MEVPFGTVTSMVAGVTLRDSVTGSAVSASFASFGGATFLGAVLASPCFVAWFEQLARIKRPAATPASHGSLALPTLPWQKNRTCVMSLMRTLLLSPADHRQAS